MSRTFKHYAKQLCLVFALLLFTVSCEKDEVIITETSENPLIANTIDKSVIDQNKGLLKTLSNLEVVLQKNKANKNTGRAYSNTYDFSINTSTANYIENKDNSYNSYTFALEKEEPSNTIENLILSQEKDGTYAPILITYFTNGQQKFAFASGETIDLEGIKVDLKKINPDFNPDDFSASQRNDDVSNASDWSYLMSILGSLSGSCYSLSMVDNDVYSAVLSPTSCSGNGGGSSGSNLPSGNGSGFPTGGNTGGGTTSTTPNNPVITSPIPPALLKKQFLQFINSLTPEQQDFLNESTSFGPKLRLQIYFDKYGHTNENENFVSELINILKEEDTVDGNALSFMLEAQAQDKLYNAFDHDFLNSVDQHMDLSTLEVTVNTDILYRLFMARVAAIRAVNPSWSNLKIYWEASKGFVHTTLDVVGVIPVAGEAADLINGAIYLFVGDMVNASLSAAAAIPFAGWAATGTKLAVKVVTLSGGGKALKIIAKTTDEVAHIGNILAGAREFLTNSSNINSFADEIIEINRRFSDGGLLNSTPLASINTALYQNNILEQGASIFKSIARNHMFNNGNKRTAVEMFKSFAEKSNITINLNDFQLLDIARKVAVGTIDDVTEIGVI